MRGGGSQPLGVASFTPPSPMLIHIFYILLGFLLLVKGGDFLIDGAVAIARRARLSNMVIGLTVVGFGTSMPELLVSTQAAWVGSSGIAIGNVAGSNIANIALILGVTALIHPIPSQRQMMRIDIPFMLIAMAFFILSASTGTIQQPVGIGMTLLLIAFVAWEVRQSRKKELAAMAAQKVSAAVASSSAVAASSTVAATGEASSKTTAPMPLWRAIALVLVSLGAMVWGADRLIEGASAIALQLGELLGASRQAMERIIGLTVVAVGTSLPELFASVIAARKGETDMAVGNIIGSVTFNILSVVGIASAITPIPDAWAPFAFDYLAMFALGLLLWLFLRTRHLLERWEGAVLLLLYLLYIAKTLIV